MQRNHGDGVRPAARSAALEVGGNAATGRADGAAPAVEALHHPGAWRLARWWGWAHRDGFLSCLRQHQHGRGCRCHRRVRGAGRLEKRCAHERGTGPLSSARATCDWPLAIDIARDVVDVTCVMPVRMRAAAFEKKRPEMMCISGALAVVRGSSYSVKRRPVAFANM